MNTLDAGTNAILKRNVNLRKPHNFFLLLNWILIEITENGSFVLRITFKK